MPHYLSVAEYRKYLLLRTLVILPLGLAVIGFGVRTAMSDAFIGFMAARITVVILTLLGVAVLIVARTGVRPWPATQEPTDDFERTASPSLAAPTAD